MNERHIVYILLSKEFPDRYYIGYTQNLEKRLQEHNSGVISSYSKRYAPWDLETFITFKNRDLAVSFEKYLKAGSGHVFLKKRFIYECIPTKPNT